MIIKFFYNIIYYFLLVCVRKFLRFAIENVLGFKIFDSFDDINVLRFVQFLTYPNKNFYNVLKAYRLF